MNIKVFLFFTVFFFSNAAKSQPILVNERWWSVGAEAGFFNLHEDYNLIAVENSFPDGRNFGVNGEYSWKQDNNRITRFGAGIRYEYMNDYRIRVPLLRSVSDNYIVDKQEAFSLQLNLVRLIPFTSSSPVYCLFGANANLSLITMFTGKHHYTSMFFSKTEVYTNSRDPIRKLLNAGLYTGIGMAITDKLRAELQVNAALPTIRYYKLNIGAQAALHYAIGKPNTTEKRIYTPQ